MFSLRFTVVITGITARNILKYMTPCTKQRVILQTNLLLHLLYAFVRPKCQTFIDYLSVFQCTYFK